MELASAETATVRAMAALESTVAEAAGEGDICPQAAGLHATAPQAVAPAKSTIAKRRNPIA